MNKREAIGTVLRRTGVGTFVIANDIKSVMMPYCLTHTISTSVGRPAAARLVRVPAADVPKEIGCASGCQSLV